MGKVALQDKKLQGEGGLVREPKEKGVKDAKRS